MLGEQTARANQFGAGMGSRSAGEYDWRTGQRSRIADEYWNLYKGAGQPDATPTGGGGGRRGGRGAAGAAPVDPLAAMESDIYNRFTNLAETGGWTEPELANYRSWTTASTPGFYTGLKNELERMNAASGGYAGYNSQAAKLSRDAARRAFETTQESESGLQQMVREAKERGLAGMQSEVARRRALQAAKRGGGGGGGGGGYGGSEKDYYLRQLTGLMGGAEDLPYAQMQLGSFGPALQSIGMRVDETPGWQRALTGLAGAAIPSAFGAFGGGGGSRGRTPSYNPSVDPVVQYRPTGSFKW